MLLVAAAVIECFGIGTRKGNNDIPGPSAFSPTNVPRERGWCFSAGVIPKAMATSCTGWM